MPLSDSHPSLRPFKLHGQSPWLVLFLALLVYTGSDLSVLYNVVVMFIIIARAPCGAVRCTVPRLKVLLSIENV